MKNGSKYRSFDLRRIYPPGPTKYRWQYSHEDYDGPEDNRVGLAETMDGCIQSIDEYYSEQEATDVTEKPKQGLRFYTGNCMDVSSPIDASEMRAVTPDGRTAFTVRLVDGKPSIEISMFAVFKLNDVLYDNEMIVKPRASNLIEITAARYPE